MLDIIKLQNKGNPFDDSDRSKDWIRTANDTLPAAFSKLFDGRCCNAKTALKLSFLKSMHM